MKIQPGLNILVGPNGSGKTNIITFFQFLSHLTTRPLPDAISMSGGAASVLQKISIFEFKRELTAKIYGIISNGVTASVSTINLLNDFYLLGLICTENYKW
jgi:recombinational DNA repair ATPase RecF